MFLDQSVQGSEGSFVFDLSDKSPDSGLWEDNAQSKYIRHPFPLTFQTKGEEHLIAGYSFCITAAKQVEQ